MKVYLSHGMGVNSTALMLLLEDYGVKFESIFADTGVEFPETYEYLDYLQEQGYKITVLKPNVNGYSNMYDYCKAYKYVPSHKPRWCTYQFKVGTIAKYVETPCIMFIAIAYDEKHRVFSKPDTNGVFNSYPLVNYGIDRQKCIEIIKEHGLKVPPRSGCYICPFISKEDVRKLYLKHRDLYEKRKELERLASERRGKPTYITYGKSTESLARENISSIEEYFKNDVLEKKEQKGDEE